MITTFGPRVYGLTLLVCRLVILLLILLSVGEVSAGPRGAVGDLYTVDYNHDRIIQVDSISGEVVGTFASFGLDGPEEAQFGPNGNLFVVNRSGQNVTEHDGQTGALIRIFADSGLNNPMGLRFETNGHLLVYNGGSYNNREEYISEYDTDGSLIGTVISGLNGYFLPLDIGNDDIIYVSNGSSSLIEQFAPDGTPLGTFASGGGLSKPEALAFGPNGNLFVASQGTASVIEYNGITGELIGTFINSKHSDLLGIVFDLAGNVWVSSAVFGLDEYDGVTGQWIRSVPNFRDPYGITVKRLSTACFAMVVSPLISGRNVTWDIDGATPGVKVSIVYGFQPGKTTIKDQFGYCATFGIQGVGLNKIVGTAIADAIGKVFIVKIIPDNARGMTVLTQAAEQGTCPDECLSNLDKQVVQ